MAQDRDKTGTRTLGDRYRARRSAHTGLTLADMLGAYADVRKRQIITDDDMNSSIDKGASNARDA